MGLSLGEEKPIGSHNNTFATQDLEGVWEKWHFPHPFSITYLLIIFSAIPLLLSSLLPF